MNPEIEAALARLDECAQVVLTDSRWRQGKYDFAPELAALIRDVAYLTTGTLANEHEGEAWAAATKALASLLVLVRAINGGDNG